MRQLQNPEKTCLSALYRRLRLAFIPVLFLCVLTSAVFAQSNPAVDPGTPAPVKKMKPVMWAADLHRAKDPTDLDTYYAATSTNQTLIISTKPVRGKGGGVMDNFYPVTITDNPPQEQDHVLVDDFYGNSLDIVVDHVRKMPPISAEAKAKDAVQYYLFITPVDTDKVAKYIGAKVGGDEFVIIHNRFDPDKYLYH